MKDSGNYALVLGGSKGLGLGTVRKLCREGIPVIALHRDRRKDLEAIRETFEGIREAGGQLYSFNGDVLSRERRSEWLETFKELLGNARIGAVIYSIAKGNLKPMQGPDKGARLTSRDFLLTAEAMAYTFYDWVSDLIRAEMLASDCRVIAFTSEGSHKVLPNYAAVGSAKASLEAIVRQMAVEWAPLGIRANCIQAGVTDTESLRRIPGSEKILSQSMRRNPSGRLTSPGDVGDAVYLLCRPEAAWITGNSIRVDGGESLR